MVISNRSASDLSDKESVRRRRISVNGRHHVLERDGFGAEVAKKMEAAFGALDDACETLRLIEVREEQER
ncbi:hypothetical protein ASE36_15460 [Rhizobium sp. Root274]|nr:hypothetical protein ASC71_15490 [Rhizobium sp. Root1240]KRD28155.1 hypothetical protein ASE36_15460 [Rhizobium sp. Root274]